MKISSTITLAVAATSTSAAVVSRAGAACPAVWTTISTDLSTLFLQSNGQCNDDARAAVRLAFHDCATWATAQGKTGGCDGSIVLSAVENARPENDGLQPISGKLAALASQNKVGVADMVAYAGAHATVSCPLGPTVKTVVGRNDSSNPAPNEALLPANASMTADMIITLFADKGFSAPDVAALIGAHTSARQDFVDPALAGEPEDRTPGIWDVSYYNDTFNQPPGVFVFQSDISVSQDSRSGPTFKSFIGQQAQWNQAFADTFARLMVLGVDTSSSNIIDCTSTLPAPRDTFAGANPPAGAPINSAGVGEGAFPSGGPGGAFPTGTGPCASSTKFLASGLGFPYPTNAGPGKLVAPTGLASESGWGGCPFA